MEQKIRILYADDEEQLRKLVKDQLTEGGYYVETADDGDTAVGMIDANAYHVILLDIKMPRMGGIEVLKYIKQKKIRSRIIMLTAVDDLSVALEAIKHGASDYLTKPYESENLLASIARVVAT